MNNNISEIIASGKYDANIYSVNLDKMILNIPKDIEFVSFALPDDYTDMPKLQAFCAKVSHWKIAFSGETVIEVAPHQNEKIDVLTKIFSQMKCGLSFLPEETDSYVEKIRVATDTALTIQNRTNDIYPISSYMEYLATKALSGIDAATPNHHYVVKVFFEPLSLEFVDKMKASMYAVVEDKFDGIDNFNKAVIACARVTARTVKEIIEQENEENTQSETNKD